MRNSGVGATNSFAPQIAQKRSLGRNFNQFSEGNQISKMKTSLEKLNQFMESLGKYKHTGLMDSVTSYYTSADLESLSCQKVLEQAKVRVEKMIKNKKLKKNWSAPDVLILVWVISKYMEKNMIEVHEKLKAEDWHKIAELIPGTAKEDCEFKWLNLHKNRLSSNQWNSIESVLLNQIVKLNSSSEGIDWKEVAKQLYKQNDEENKVFRNAKQCREHWSCYLNPIIKKGPWQEDEDQKLILEILSHKGAKKWSVIAKKFNGRTENALKNRYNLIIEKEMKNMKEHNGREMKELEILSYYLTSRGISERKKSEYEEEKNEIVAFKAMENYSSKDSTEKMEDEFNVGSCSAFSMYQKNEQLSYSLNEQEKTSRLEWNRLPEDWKSTSLVTLFTFMPINI